jgi:serine/threonine protein kinase
MEGGCLLDYVLAHPNGKLSERETKVIVHQLLQAANFIHLSGYFHGDIQPENIFLE